MTRVHRKDGHFLPRLVGMMRQRRFAGGARRAPQQNTLLRGSRSLIDLQAVVMNQASGRPSGKNNKAAAAETRSPIPWCDRRRTYCASGCSLRDKLSNSGACDWEARMAALPPTAYIDEERLPRDSDRQPGSSDPNRQPRPNMDRQPRSQEQARQPGPRNQQHPRAKFENGRRKGQGQGPQRRPNDSAVPAAPGAAVAPAQDVVPVPGGAPAAPQPDMFTAPPVIHETVAPAPAPTPASVPAVAVANDSPVSEAPATND